MFFGKSIVYLETQITPFGEPNICFGKPILSFEAQLINDLRDGNRNLGYFYLNHSFLRSVPGLQYDNLVHVHTGHTNVSNDLLVNTITDRVNHCIKHSQLCKK